MKPRIWVINQEFHPFINEFHQHIANERNYMINLNKEKENVSPTPIYYNRNKGLKNYNRPSFY